MTQNKQPKDSKEAKEPKAAKPKKDKAKAEKDKKPGVGKRIGRFFRELKAELKKVAWPSRAETLRNTGIVIVCVIVVGVIVWIFDGIASALIDALLSLFGR
ncbi:MAG: preprotein translocase subunit SecE [Ruminiclostridium sp.]|nr:preprotein translocase subunit SecE [Ruminiclostridium sp.]MCI9466773.1 preprotein translocase subunit SecE [Ruminiclostridium sp.]